MTGFTVYPAIDVRDGRVVRLAQGDYARETRYEGAPLQVAQRYAAQGAEWLHLVDLDAARAGGYTLAPLLGEIARTTALKVQTGGGVRQRDDVARILDAGAQRVVVGSLAVREPDTVLSWLAEFGSEHITVALDMLPYRRRMSRDAARAEGSSSRPLSTRSRMLRPPGCTAHASGCASPRNASTSASLIRPRCTARAYLARSFPGTDSANFASGTWPTTS